MDFAALQHSVFLQALGSAILNSLWQGFIIWIIYETINVSYKNAPSAFKNKLSTFFIFISFLWFIISFITGLYIDENFSSIAISPASITPAESSKETAFGIRSIISYARGSLPYLSVSYVFLLIFLMFKLFSSYRYVYFIANRSLVSPPFELQHFASKVAAQLNITKKISVWISNHIDVPATIGFLKPVILIPVASINSLSSHQLEAIILHELSHIKRNDYITNLFISVIETILFFNPFIFLLAKTIKRERENCCDDFVIQYRYDPYSYASALLRLEQSRRSKLKLAIGAVSGKKQLLTRIKRITNEQVVSKQFDYGQKLLALLLVTFIICSVAWLSPQEKKKTITSYILKNAKKIAKPNLAVKVIPENINIETLLPEIKIEKENLRHSNKQLVASSNLLPLALLPVFKTDFNMFNGELDSDNKKLAEQDQNRLFASDENSNIPELFFNENVLQLMPLKLLEDYSLQNLNVHIDINELNKNLKEAYKGIHAMDWKKIQNDIKESLAKLKTDQLSERAMSEFYNKDLKNLLVIRNEKKETSNRKALLPDLRKKIISIDSLRNLEIDNAHIPTHKFERHQEMKDANGLKENENSYYSYNFESVPLPKPDFNALPKNSYPKIITISRIKNKNAKIIVESLNAAYKESKNHYNYSSPNKPGKKTTQQKIITIELNETP
ncbi:MAG: M56 family metallopeptidase [Ginsengibacter sp.]